MVRSLKKLLWSIKNKTHPKTGQTRKQDPVTNATALEIEYNLYCTVVQENNNLKTIREALRYVNTIGLYKVSLQNILILLELGAICPFGNAVTERLFSLMKIVKSRLRNRLGQSTLD